MEYVFISYVRENTEDVNRLAETLKAFGIEVWLDKEQIRPGSRWKDAIQDAINQGAFFIACFSAEYSQRMKTYMNEELTLAIEELRQRPTDRSWFIPVLLNESSIPDRRISAVETLRSLHYVRLDQNWDEGIQSILSVIQPVSGAIYKLIQQLSDKSARARIKAADGLGKMGGIAERAIPALVELLEDNNETVRAAAADALGNIGIPDRQVILKLLSVTRDDEHPDYPSVLANSSLVKMGANAVPTLIEALDGSGYRIHEAAYKTLGEIGEAASPELIKALESDSPSIRAGAAAALAIIGESAKVVTESPLPGLLRMLEQGSPTAAGALGEIKDPAAVPGLVAKLSDENYLSVSASLALGKIGDSSAVQPLIDVLRDENKFWVPRGAAAVALGDMGRAAESAVPALVEALNYDVHNSGETWDERAREAVVDALRRIRDPSAPSSLEGHGYRYEMWGIY
jgi:HEAT repeat protein